jgi:glutamate formiminotransferase / 5-formyltetrahydrofolate cyclo-ligase
VVRSVTTLLAVPNVSEGRSTGAIGQIGAAFDGRLLDVHADRDHHRSVFTLAGAPGELAQTVVRGAARAVELITIDTHDGIHPRVGAIDVAPIIYLRPEDRGAACAEALVLADLLGEQLELPVFLYGILADGRTRAELRRGGPQELGRRIAAGELTPDFGPARLHPGAGATLVAARPPLVAFNVELRPPATLAQAKQIAAAIREGGSEGLPGVRAIGLWLEQLDVAQVSTNVEDHLATPLAAVVAAVARYAEPAGAELVGLAPKAAFAGFPSDISVRGYATIEDTLASTA